MKLAQAYNLLNSLLDIHKEMQMYRDMDEFRMQNEYKISGYMVTTILHTVDEAIKLIEKIPIFINEKEIK